MYKRLRQNRKGLSLTCQDMAELLGFTDKNTYSRKERGVVNFSLEEGKKIADFFGEPVEELFFKD